MPSTQTDELGNPIGTQQGDSSNSDYGGSAGAGTTTGSVVGSTGNPPAPPPPLVPPAPPPPTTPPPERPIPTYLSGSSPTYSPSMLFNPPSVGAPSVNAPSAQLGAAAGSVNPASGSAATYNATTAGGSANVAPGTVVGTRANAVTGGVNAATDTIEGRMGHLLDTNSPLMQRAEQLANERSNATGMLNSSMGVNAAQGALYDRALQIASPDAAEYSATRRSNQIAQNSAELQNAQNFTDVAKTNVANALQAGVINQDQANRIAQFNAGLTTDASKFGAMSSQDMSKFNIANLLQAGIINQDQANKMTQFNSAEANALARQNSINETGLTSTAMQVNASERNAARSANTQLAVTAQNNTASAAATQLTNTTNRLNAMDQNSTSVQNQKWGVVNSILQNPDFTQEYRQQLLKGLGPEFASMATATVGSVAADMGGGPINGDTRIQNGSPQVLNNGRWSFAPHP